MQYIPRIEAAKARQVQLDKKKPDWSSQLHKTAAVNKELETITKVDDDGFWRDLGKRETDPKDFLSSYFQTKYTYYSNLVGILL